MDRHCLQTILNQQNDKTGKQTFKLFFSRDSFKESNCFENRTVFPFNKMLIKLISIFK